MVRLVGGTVRGANPEDVDAEARHPKDTLHTDVGRGVNTRVEDLKGPWIKTIEGVAEDLSDAMLANVHAMREANGPIPAFQQPLSPERIAALHLPEWFARGNQEPTSPAAQDYWNKRLSEPNDNSPKAAGPSGATLFQKQMASLWKNPKYRAIALDSMNPELRQELLQAVQQGLHPGYAHTLQDGKRARIEEDGSIDDHLNRRPAPGGA